MLDPACGSGNFLYVALRLLLDLWKEVCDLCRRAGADAAVAAAGLAPSPAQLYGIEINDYAHELAQATVWIGYIQWLHDNGFGFPAEPILKPLDNIQQMDAILAYRRGQGRPGGAGVAGGGRDRRESAVFGRQARCAASWATSMWTHLFKLYERPRARRQPTWCATGSRRRGRMIEQGKAKRAGLLATNSIRGGANRKVLERIKETGDIFWAQSDRDLDTGWCGCACFDDWF